MLDILASAKWVRRDKAGNRPKRADDPVSPLKTLEYPYDGMYEMTEVYHVEGGTLALEKARGHIFNYQILCNKSPISWRDRCE
jgi:hypothetical protein